jgi:probable HAF family extracellular repeat protein
LAWANSQSFKGYSMGIPKPHVFALLTLITIAPPARPQNHTIFDYSEIVVPGLTGPTATAINGRGDIVGYGTGASGTTAFLASGGNFTLLSAPGSTSTQANGINDNGDVVGTYTDSAGSHGFKYSAGAYTTIDAPPPALPNTTSLTAINNIGQIGGNATVIAQGTTLSATDGFVDTAGTFGFVPTGPEEFFSLNGLNDGGNNAPADIVGSDGGAGTPTAPAYGTTRSYTRVQNLDGGSYTAMNDGGQGIYVRGVTSYVIASVYEPAQSPPSDEIFVQNSSQTTGLGMNNAGAVVGYYLDSAGARHAFLAATRTPTCIITSSSPPQMSFSVQDSRGLTRIQTGGFNANVNVPPFATGTTSPVVVTATAINPAQTASVSLNAENNQALDSFCNSRIAGTGAQWFGLGGVLTSNVGVVTIFDGFDAYGLGSDSALWHITQSAASGPWGSWSGLGGASFTSEPAVAADDAGLSTGIIEVLEISADGTLWHIAQKTRGDWSGATWDNLGSGFKGRPALIADSNRTLHAFVRTSNDSILALTQSNPGSANWPAVSLGGVVTSNPAAALDGAGSLQVVATGTDQALWNSGVTISGDVIPWSSAGGSLKGDPSLISRGGVLYAFGRGDDDSVLFNFKQSNQWGSWQSLGGVIVDNPRAILNYDGRAEVFVAGTDNAVWHTAQTAGGSDQWSPWSTLGGIISGDVVPSLDVSGAVNLFVIGGDQGLWNMTQPLPGFWY